MTKVHLDQILSQNYSQLDVSFIIEAMQQTIDFENELIKRWPADEPTTRSMDQTNKQVNIVDGTVEVAASGNASDIKKKYAKEKDEDERNQEVFANL